MRDQNDQIRSENERVLAEKDQVIAQQHKRNTELEAQLAEYQRKEEEKENRRTEERFHGCLHPIKHKWCIVQH